MLKYILIAGKGGKKIIFRGDENVYQKNKKIGILTSGGDAPGLNAVIRATVITAIRQYEWEVIGINAGFEGMLDDSGALLRKLELQDVINILQLGGTILGTTNQGHFGFSKERPEELADPTVADQAIVFCKKMASTPS